MSTFPRCLIVGSSLMLGSGYFASVENMYPFPLEILFIVVLMFVLLCSTKWAPATDLHAVCRLKGKVFITVSVWAGCVPALIYCQYNNLALAMILGAIVSVLLISPLGFGLMGFIDRMLDYLGKGVVN